MKRVRIGVVGCGAIAQVHHLPNLNVLSDQFEVAVVCDVSPSAAADAARRFHVARHVTDYRELLGTDLDAVLLCHTDPKTAAAIAVLEAGKHLFIEKPLCFSLPEIDAMIAAQGAGTVAQAGYMKVYDPAFELAQKAVAEMGEIRFVQVNHLHPSNDLHLRRFDDCPAAAIEQTAAARRVAVRQALGDAPPEVERAFNLPSSVADYSISRWWLVVPFNFNLHQSARRHRQWYAHKQMHMVRLHRSSYHLHVVAPTDLLDQVPHPMGHLSS